MADGLSLALSYTSGVKFLHDVAHSPEIAKIFSILCYSSKLEDLRRAIFRMHPILQPPDGLTHSTRMRHMIDDLRDAVLYAEDLFDCHVTLNQLNDDSHICKKMLDFFSPTNPLLRAYQMATEIDNIRSKLQAIASDMQITGNPVYEPMKYIRAETDSCQEEHFIGRDYDLDIVLGMLTVDSKAVNFISVVGMAGVGKTALCKRVYHHEKVKQKFELRIWTCISDHDQLEVDGSNFLRKICDSISANDQSHKGLNLEQLQKKVKTHLENKRFLLVLDDVWIEDDYRWETQFKKYIININIGKKGSTVLVTTRSKATAKIISYSCLVMSLFLQQLSVDDSFRLLERKSQPSDLEEVRIIGRKIAEACAGNPLAICVVGSFLRDKDINIWRSLQEHGLVRFLQDPKGVIMPILMWSYRNLDPALQSCFRYSALFPKGFEIRKSTLTSLWIAQGYVVPLWEGQSVEVAAEEYFSILLQRCFFQDTREIYDQVYSCKIHDLMHDLAQMVSKTEICATNTAGNETLGKNVLHLSIAKSEALTTYSFKKSRVRSYLHVGTHHLQHANMDQAAMKALVANCMQLRALDLNRSQIRSLPESIGNLLHLRYLNLSHNEDLEVLPQSITKLYNLQTLILTKCKNLRELPQYLSRLVKLRVLGISLCSKLKYMPRNMGILTCLHNLSDFKVGCDNGTTFGWKQWFDAMEDLMVLNNLTGGLAMDIGWPANDGLDVEEADRQGGSYLSRKEQLKRIEISFQQTDEEDRMEDEDKIRLMEKLQPHETLKFLNVGRYDGSRMPNWATELPNLVKLNLHEFDEMKFLPCFGKLKHLKMLKLTNMKKLEYIQVGSHFSPAFFPSLEKLTLENLSKLEGWKKEVRSGDHHQPLHTASSGSSRSSSSKEAELLIRLRLPQLKTLCIWGCPELTCIPACPKVESLRLSQFNQRLLIIDTGDSREVPKLLSVSTDNMAWLISLPMQAFQGLEKLKIEDGNMMQSLENLKDMFRSCSSSLKCMEISFCHDLDSFAKLALSQLTGLEELLLEACEQPEEITIPFQHEHVEDQLLNAIPEEGEEDQNQQILLHTLHALTLRQVKMNTTLPDWMQSLSSLHHLYIDNCSTLSEMPEWMPRLESLQKLEVTNCLESLEKRCLKSPYLCTPENDWHLIQHIWSISFDSRNLRNPVPVWPDWKHSSVLFSQELSTFANIAQHNNSSSRLYFNDRRKGKGKSR